MGASRRTRCLHLAGAWLSVNPMHIILSLIAVIMQAPASLELIAQDPTSAYANMVRIPSGSFAMGGDAGLMDGGSHSHQTAYPIHEVTVDAFWMDVAEVTNRQFAEFVEATGYVTFAERPLPAGDVAALQQVADYNIKQLQLAADSVAGPERAAIYESIQRIKDSSQLLGQTAGSIIFELPEAELRSESDITQWWRIEAAATWRAPDGVGSNWQDRLDHPVVNVTHDDAAKYAAWAGKRLPTEAEWERAARGGLERQPFAWGDVFAPLGEDVWMANIWQGVWPYENTKEDGFAATAPVKSFPPNAFGLYDMAGNVWEIVADRYHPKAYSLRTDGAINPTGPDVDSLSRLRQRLPTYVTRGGSFLCSDGWCSGYQPGSRQSLENDSPAHHTGFRCVKDVN
ncbi:MAG: formylglycine-generating enzyme family protein [Puniceicoccaceae bacterium]|nr:MAG: formylglycine-generating enzyme family protein [Puniceicoccaceae bacterium]